MGAGASSTGSVMAANDHFCFGYWDTSTNRIHMVRLNSTDSTTMSTVSPSSSRSSLEEIPDAIPEEGDVDEVEEIDAEEEKLVPVSSVNINNKGRKLSTEIITMPKRFKLRHSGYTRLQSKENVERRLSGVKLQEMESVDMPLKAAKILVGNPMRLKMDNKEHVDSDEDTDVPIGGHFDIVSLHKKPMSTTVHLPQLRKDMSLVQSSKHSATILTSSDTQITMVLPRKAAKILLGETQVKTSPPSKTTTGKPTGRYICNLYTYIYTGLSLYRKLNL